ncbi:hypothetical protein AJ80_03648 [Polytolypa hystricis UAMH7299]|uniref:Peptidase A1 domain-containing protein n=1 Tax=Polytolypa hystricis (strain UAMH7299) TaxID=1447883 RepID=A0A2B7YGS7_POLH7|nr:hypothetical protein AJ80_03648 [Polytolypa hystricis UAMH7299]
MWTNCLFITAILLGLSIAAPSSKRTADFTIRQVARSRQTWQSPVDSYRRALLRFERSVSKIDTLSPPPGQQGTVQATPDEDDMQYLSPVKVGDQTLNVAIDTGSADLWVFSSGQPQSQLRERNYYTPGASAKKLEGASWYIHYGDGTDAGGDVYMDEVVVGSVKAPSQAVQAARNVSSVLVEDGKIEGIMGLGFNSHNTVKPQRQRTFFENVMDSLSRPLFTVSLKYHKPGAFDFGFIDCKKYKGDITYTAVNSTGGWWEFTASSYAVGDKTFNTPITGIADTGTTYLLLPDRYVNNYYAHVPNATKTHDSWEFPCNTTLPPFTMIISGTTGNKDSKPSTYRATVPGKHLNAKSIHPGSDTCFGGLQPTSLDSGTFGDVFFKSQFVIFDRSSPEPILGFAEALDI